MVMPNIRSILQNRKYNWFDNPERLIVYNIHSVRKLLFPITGRHRPLTRNVTPLVGQLRLHLFADSDEPTRPLADQPMANVRLL